MVLAVHDVEAQSDRELPALRGVSFDVRAGEILGVAGVAGNGQSELAQVLTGLRRCTAGSISVNGVEVANHTPREVIDQHIGHVPEDRTGVGTAPDLSIADNLIMKSYRDAPVARRWSIDAGAVRRFATRLRDVVRDRRRRRSTRRRACCRAATSSDSSSPARSPRSRA